jgi:hypothetical protein
VGSRSLKEGVREPQMARASPRRRQEGLSLSWTRVGAGVGAGGDASEGVLRLVRMSAVVGSKRANCKSR